MGIVKILLSVPVVLTAWLIECFICALFWLPIQLVWGKNTFESLRSEKSLSEWLMVEADH